jgi:nitroreductase
VVVVVAGRALAVRAELFAWAAQTGTERGWYGPDRGFSIACFRQTNRQASSPLVWALAVACVPVCSPSGNGSHSVAANLCRMDFQQLIRRRRMVRNYDQAKPVTREQLERIVAAAQRAPSAGFSQGQRLAVVTSDAKRREIAEICHEPEYVSAGFDPWVSRAPALVVPCVSERIYRDRYDEPDKRAPGEPPMEWPIPYWWVDAGATMMLILLAVVNEGLAAGFLGTHRVADLQVALELPPDMVPIGVVTIGHPLPDRKSGSLKRGWVPRDDFARWFD